HLVVGLAEGEHQLVEQLVGAAAQDDPLGRDAELVAERAPQEHAARVGVEVDAGERAPHGVERAQRRAERVLVRGDLQGAPRRQRCSELALQLLDRLARLVDVEGAYVRGRDLVDPATAGHVSSALRYEPSTRIVRPSDIARRAAATRGSSAWPS